MPQLRLITSSRSRSGYPTPEDIERSKDFIGRLDTDTDTDDVRHVETEMFREQIVSDENMLTELHFHRPKMFEKIGRLIVRNNPKNENSVVIQWETPDTDYGRIMDTVPSWYSGKPGNTKRDPSCRLIDY